MSQESGTPEELVKTEYVEVCANFRHYSSLRFGILTVYFAVLVILGAPILNFGLVTQPVVLISLKIIGLVITFVFWRYQETAMGHLAHYGDRAKEIEAILGYSNLSTRPTPKRWFARMSFATRLLYGTMMLFWLITFLF
jgi:hypothetical protein